MPRTTRKRLRSNKRRVTQRRKCVRRRNKVRGRRKSVMRRNRVRVFRGGTNKKQPEKPKAARCKELIKKAKKNINDRNREIKAIRFIFDFLNYIIKNVEIESELDRYINNYYNGRDKRYYTSILNELNNTNDSDKEDVGGIYSHFRIGFDDVTDSDDEESLEKYYNLKKCLLKMMNMENYTSYNPGKRNTDIISLENNINTFITTIIDKQDTISDRKDHPLIPNRDKISNEWDELILGTVQREEILSNREYYNGLLDMDMVDVREEVFHTGDIFYKNASNITETKALEMYGNTMNRLKENYKSINRVGYLIGKELLSKNMKDTLVYINESFGNMLDEDDFSLLVLFLFL